MNDNFYEERFKQLKNDLFIGDATHTLGKEGAMSFLYRLFDECFTFDEIFGILDNIHRHAKDVNKSPFIDYSVARMFLKKEHGYMITDKSGKVKIDYWDGDRFRYTDNPQLVMLHADIENYRGYFEK